jgi:uncharacterized membrane protein
MNRGQRLATLARGVLVFAAVTPFVPALFHGFPVLDGFARLLDSWFAFQCERDPTRGFPGVAVCARCLGVYLGLGLGALFGRPRIPLRWLQLWIVAAAALLLLDALTEAHGLRPPAATLRILTGFLFAYPVGVVIILALTPKP